MLKSVENKATFCGIYKNFSSFIALRHKFALVYTLLHRCFTIVCDFSKFHFEIETLKKHFTKMLTASTKFTGKCIWKFLDNILVERPAVTTLPKLEILIVSLL